MSSKLMAALPPAAVPRPSDIRTDSEVMRTYRSRGAQDDETFHDLVKGELAAAAGRIVNEHMKMIAAARGGGETSPDGGTASAPNGRAVNPVEGEKTPAIPQGSSRGHLMQAGVSDATKAFVSGNAGTQTNTTGGATAGAAQVERSNTPQASTMAGMPPDSRGEQLQQRSRNNSIIGWEGSRYELHSLWTDMLMEREELSVPNRLLSARAMTFELQSMSSSVFSRIPADLSKLEVLCASSPLVHMMIHPSSQRRLGWDLIGMLLVVYDIITIPLQVFHLEVNLFSTLMAYVIAIFWTIDLPSGFLTGFIVDGRLVMNPLHVAKKYLSTWFFLDLLLVTVDWFILLVEDEGSTAVASLGITRFGKAFRVARILRVLRLLRLMKLPRYLGKFEERIESELTAIVIGIVKLTVAILLINHMVACVWYGLATGEYKGSRTWVEMYVRPDDGTPYRYATALHWSLTQFTPAGMEVYPQNTIERMYNIIVVIFAMVTFSWFVSSITNAMTHLRNMNSEYARQLLELSRFIRYHRISSQLSTRMRRHLEHVIMRGHAEITEKDVPLLKLLSEPLLMELHVEVYSAPLKTHPLFQKFAELNTVAMRKICHKAITPFTISHGDCHFSWGETCENMYFLKTGRIIYTQEKGDGGINEVVSSGSWMCEACLWTNWRHMGWAYAASKVSMISLEASKFLIVIRTSSTPTLQPAMYGNAFVSFLNRELGTANGTGSMYGPVTDLYHEGFDMDGALHAACTFGSLRGSQATSTTPSRRLSMYARAGDDETAPQQDLDTYSM